MGGCGNRSHFSCSMSQIQSLHESLVRCRQVSSSIHYMSTKSSHLAHLAARQLLVRRDRHTNVVPPPICDKRHTVTHGRERHVYRYIDPLLAIRVAARALSRARPPQSGPSRATQSPLKTLNGETLSLFGKDIRALILGTLKKASAAAFQGTGSDAVARTCARRRPDRLRVFV